MNAIRSTEQILREIIENAEDRYIVVLALAIIDVAARATASDEELAARLEAVERRVGELERQMRVDPLWDGYKKAAPPVPATAAGLGDAYREQARMSRSVPIGAPEGTTLESATAIIYAELENAARARSVKPERAGHAAALVLDSLTDAIASVGAPEGEKDAGGEVGYFAPAIEELEIRARDLEDKATWPDRAKEYGPELRTEARIFREAAVRLRSGAVTVREDSGLLDVLRAAHRECHQILTDAGIRAVGGTPTLANRIRWALARSTEGREQGERVEGWVPNWRGVPGDGSEFIVMLDPEAAPASDPRTAPVTVIFHSAPESSGEPEPSCTCLPPPELERKP